MNACMKNSFFVLLGLLCGSIVAIIMHNISLEKAFYQQSKKINFSSWKKMNVEIDNGRIIWDTFGSKTEIFFDTNGVMNGFNFQQKFVSDSNCSITLGYDIVLNKHESFCQMRNP